MKSLLRTIKGGFNKLGFNISRYPDFNSRMKYGLIDQLQINEVIDVGSNKGQFIDELKRSQYNNNIIGIEPLIDEYEHTRAKFKNINNILLLNIGLGEKEMRNVEINVSENSHSSSIKSIKNLHVNSAPDSKYKGKQIINIQTLDYLIDNYIDDVKNKNIFLKIDTQGYEKEVLKGLTKNIDRVKLVQIEMSLDEVYDDSISFFELHEVLINLGFKLFSIERGFVNKNTGQLLQVDGLYINKKTYENIFGIAT